MWKHIVSALIKIAIICIAISYFAYHKDTLIESELEAVLLLLSTLVIIVLGVLSGLNIALYLKYKGDINNTRYQSDYGTMYMKFSKIRKFIHLNPESYNPVSWDCIKYSGEKKNSYNEKTHPYTLYIYFPTLIDYIKYWKYRSRRNSLVDEAIEWYILSVKKDLTNFNEYYMKMLNEISDKQNQELEEVINDLNSNPIELTLESNKKGNDKHV